eukprot:NODE_17802_length_361_cov_36.037815_g17485_i0.p1 GENE.NODE_17802_length_361_cov_36.037815_g17485_i0~~NODE_17802_length_361_cov_36.037815_g17485_i0.p1  ORF type:complete len:108 (+),score=22.78 NODE_17802_length_361_cov_36.037815_g17485_i0:46-324(+)
MTTKPFSVMRPRHMCLCHKDNDDDRGHGHQNDNQQYTHSLAAALLVLTRRLKFCNTNLHVSVGLLDVLLDVVNILLLVHNQLVELLVGGMKL